MRRIYRERKDLEIRVQNPDDEKAPAENPPAAGATNAKPEESPR